MAWRSVAWHGIASAVLIAYGTTPIALPASAHANCLIQAEEFNKKLAERDVRHQKEIVARDTQFSFFIKSVLVAVVATGDPTTLGWGLRERGQQRRGDGKGEWEGCRVAACHDAFFTQASFSCSSKEASTSCPLAQAGPAMEPRSST